MRNLSAIFQREIVGFFGHPVGYIVLSIFVGLLAVFALWFDDLLVGGVASMRRPFLWIAACFIFLVPAVTMRLLAEERRTGSLQLLATLPVTPEQVVVGKWLAAVALVGVALLLTASYPLALALLGDLDPGPMMGGYLGLLLAGSAFAAVGTATSALTESQVVAFLLASTACLLPVLMGYALPLFPATWVPLVQYLTFEYHFSNLARGVLDTRSLVFFVTVTALALRCAVLILEHRRLS